MTVDQIKSLAKKHGFITKDPSGFITPGEYLGVKISLYVATGNNMSDGYDYAGFDGSGKLIAVGEESGGLGASNGGGWVWIDGEFGVDIPKTRLSALWEC